MGLDFLSGLSGISTLMGLENLAKKPTESATPTSDSPTSSSSTPSGGLTTITGPGGKKIVVDQSSSDQIYKNLQDQYNLRNSEFADWQNRMMAARAAAIPNLHGESSNAQLALRQQQETERKDRLAMLMDMAAMKGSQAQQNLLRTSLAGSMISNTGAGVSGTGGAGTSQTGYAIPDYIQKQILDLANAGDVDAAIKLRDEYQKPAEKSRAENIYNIEWDKKIVAGIRQPDGSIKNQLVSLRELNEIQKQSPDKVQYTKDPSNNTQIENPVGSGSAAKKTAPPPVSHPEFEPIQKTAPATPTQFNPNAPAPSVKPIAPVTPQSSAAPPPANLAQNTSVFANVKPIMTADASGRVPIGHVDIPPPPSANAPKAAAPVQQLALNTANLPMAPEAVQKEANVPLDIATTRGNEAAKADEADTAQLIKDSKQAQDMLRDLDAYQQHLTKHSHVFGVAQANPITSTIASAENVIPGNWHGISNIIADAELRDPVDKQNLVDARGLANKIGITFSKANFPGRMTNMELGQSQIAKGLDVNSGVVSNQLALNRAKFAAEQTVKLKDTWDAYKYWMEKDPNNKHHEVASYATFTNTPAYHQIVDAKFPKQEDTFTPIKTSKGHTVEKVSE